MQERLLVGLTLLLVIVPSGAAGVPPVVNNTTNPPWFSMESGFAAAIIHLNSSTTL
jgi:hypothetical protein